MDKIPICFYRISVIVIIVIFLGLVIQPAFANNIYNIELEKAKNNKTKKSEAYEEIITFIKGRT